MSDAPRVDRERPHQLIPAALIIAAVSLAAGCTATAQDIPPSHSRPTPSSPVVPSANTAATASTTGSPGSNVPVEHPHLVAWHGPVEELFVHPLVLNPKLAFTNDRLGRGFADYFVTAREFRLILAQLWRNGWTLVDVHRAATGTVRVPRGRRPLVLSEDDVNYYRYFAGRGLASRLVLNQSGHVRAAVHGQGLTSNDVVSLVEREVHRHPEFSADGAKGVLAVTGYEGLLGEHHPYRPAARGRLRRLADWLRAHGWTFASHTYGHLDLAASSLDEIARDTHRWKVLTRPLLGRVDVLTYPYGSRPSSAGVRLLDRAGFDIQLDIDIRARHFVRRGAVIMSRRHIDGLAFEVPERLAPFFDVAAVRDPARSR
jgi:hypothetical protein